jgi:mono/diheme cytochrome c family protein
MQLSPSDRTFMRHFAIMIAMLAGAAVILIIIGTFVWASQAKQNDPLQEQRASDRITRASAVYAGSAGEAALAAAAPTPPAASAAVPSGPYSYDAAKGKSMFDSTCAACHQAGGEGVAGTFPPLKGNPAVDDANPKAQIETILNGRQGTAIAGKTYSGVMPPFGSQLTDVQVADIANYERTSWGNHAKQITAADVAAVRGGK